MSFLTPLYALGALAVVAPIVFHLIRRAPRGDVPFSSLMFLSPSPPRLTRRSRLDNLLLLLLRAAVLCLLAFAFARPFLRQAATLSFGDVERRRVAVLVDTSASLRRGDLWQKARKLAGEMIDASRPGDQLAVFAFDVTSKPILSFAESAALDPAKRQAVARAKLDGLAPSWASTNLGQALIDAVATVEDVADSSEKAGRMPRRVVLISDLQHGSKLDALGDFEWPSDVELELKTVADDGANAGLQWLADAAEAEPSAEAAPAAGNGPPLRVRVSNEPGSRQESFALQWVDEKGAGTGKPVEVYVPPGESRVVRVPRPSGPSPSQALRLSGDRQGFDDTIYLAAGRRDDATVLYVGPDAAGDPAGLLYYLERVFQGTARRGVTVVSRTPSAPLALEGERSVALVVLAAETTPENAGRLRAFADGGGTVLQVLDAPGQSATLAALTGTAPQDFDEANVGRDVLLGEIAFDHPLFAPLAGPQFNDFTKIHFWKYRRIDPDALGGARVLARFENGDAAVVEKALGKGRLVVLASGWNPADSQLARSSKFVPLMAALLEGPGARRVDAEDHRVGDPVPLLGAGETGKLVVRKPDGTSITVPPGSETFGGTDLPGVYQVDAPGAGGARAFAVNLDPSESKTAPLGVETLEQLGCRLARGAPGVVDRERLRQLQNAELEGRQKLWRWLIVAALGVLIVETWLAGRVARPRPAPAESLAS
jgi:hypothetical protein